MPRRIRNRNKGQKSLEQRFKALLTQTAKPVKARSTKTQFAPRAPNVASSQQMMRRTPKPGKTRVMKMPTDIKYITCRLFPWNSSGGMIPDNSSARSIMIDHRTYCDVTTGTNNSGGNFTFRTLPSLPFMGMIKPGAAAGANALTINGTGTVSLPDNGLKYGWIPCLEAPEYYLYSLDPTVTDANNPFDAIRARIVTQAVNVTYSGTANNCSGIITVKSTPTALYRGATQSVGLTVMNWHTGAVVTYAANAVGTYNIDLPAQTSVYTSESTQCRPEVGCQSIVKHNGPTYNWQTFSEFPNIIVPVNTATPTSTNTLLYNGGNGNAATASQLNGSMIYDADWDSVEYNFSGLTSGTSVRIEMVTCVEYEVSPTSPFVRLAAKRPPQDLKAIAITETVLKSAPVSFPSTDSKGLLRSALKMASTMAPIVGAGFGPVGMGIATGAAAVADGLASLVL